MADLDTTVSVSVDAQTTSPTAEGFGLPLIVGFHTHYTDDRVRYYDSLAGMIADGFTTTESLYRAAESVFSQNPRPATVGVGRLTTASTMVTVLTPIVQNSHIYVVTINGTDHTVQSDANATATEICDALRTSINGGAQAGEVTASGTTTLIITADTAGEVYSLEHDYADFDQQNTTTDGSGIAAQIAAIQLEDDAWYALIMDSFGKAEILAVAAYIETQDKIGVFVTGDSDVLASGSSDVGSSLSALNYTKSSLWFSRNPHEYLNAAIAGAMLPTDPGSATWKFKTVAGVSADAYTPTVLGRLVTKHVNHYIERRGVSITAEGVTSSGEFIDVPIFIDWLVSEIQLAIFTIMVNLPKIPLTDSGIALVQNGLQGALKRGVSAGGLDGSDPDLIQIIVPRARDISPADRAARRLTGISFQAPLAGAVHFVDITGTVTA